MEIMRNIIVGIVLIVMTVGCVTSDVRDDAVKTFEVPYLLNYEVVNRTGFEWRDEFLEQSSFVYSQRLAGPLSALAACVYGYRHDMDCHTLDSVGFKVVDLMRHYGDDIDYAHPKYGKNQVGFTFASKRVRLDGEMRDVLLVLVRGTFGRDEWISNINMCNTWGMSAIATNTPPPELHEGFRIATDAVQEALQEYVAKKKIDVGTAKIVITGHSRGAAVANILGARIDDGKLFPDARLGNVFVYTFATPNTVLRSDVEAGATRYSNIFNIINPEDMVPLVPILHWHARRYGTDLYLKNYDELNMWEVWFDLPYNEMKDEFKRMTGYEWWHTPFGTNSTHFVPSLLGKLAPTMRELYAVPKAQGEMGNMTSIHSIMETIIYRNMKDAKSQERELSLGGDVQSLTQVYKKVNDPETSNPSDVLNLFASDYFSVPDGRDFSNQPGFFHILWRLSCMHATQTYIGWMKAADIYGPEAVYKDCSVYQLPAHSSH